MTLHGRGRVLPPLGGVAAGRGEILVSIADEADVDAFCSVFGEGDGFSKELRALVPVAWPGESGDEDRPGIRIVVEMER